MFQKLGRVCDTQHYECTKCHLTIDFKMINFMLCDFCLKITIKNSIKEYEMLRINLKKCVSGLYPENYKTLLIKEDLNKWREIFMENCCQFCIN